MNKSTGFQFKKDHAAAWHRWVVEGIFLLGFLAYVLFFYPGFMSNDSVNQLLQARSGIYSDWHPPLMAMTWRVVEQLGFEGGFGMLMLQALLIWTGAYFVHRAYFFQGGVWTAGILFLMLFFPPLFGIAGVIWKDNLMWGLLFVAIGGIGLVRTDDQDKISWRDWLLSAWLGIFLLAALLMRFNAVFAIGPLLILLYCRLFGCRRLRSAGLSLVAAFVTLVLLLVLAGYINDKVADHKEHAWLSVAAFDTVGVIVRLPDHVQRQALYERIPKSLRIAKDADSLIPAYTPRYWVTPGRGTGAPLRFNPHFYGAAPFDQLSDSEREQMKEIWVSLPFKHTMEWLRHRIAVFEQLVGWTKDELWSPVFMKTNGFDNRYVELYGLNRESSTLQKAIEWRLSKLQSYWLFRPWFYLVLALLVLGYATFNFNLQRLTPLLLLLSGLLHEMGLFLFAPSVDYRYSHYFIFSVILAVLVLFLPAPWTRKSQDT